MSDEVEIPLERGEFFLRTAPRSIRKYQGRKPGYAINRVHTQLLKAVEDFADEIQIINTRHALTENKDDPTSRILTTGDGPNLRYEYSKDGAIARDKEIRTKRKETKVKIRPFFMPDIPADLTETELEAFAGLVIRQEDVDRIFEERWNAPVAGSVEAPEGSEEPARSNDAISAAEVSNPTV